MDSRALKEILSFPLSLPLVTPDSSISMETMGASMGSVSSHTPHSNQRGLLVGVSKGKRGTFINMLTCLKFKNISIHLFFFFFNLFPSPTLFGHAM